MKLSIVDKEIKHTLDLDAEEVVRLIKMEKSPGRYGSSGEIVSPILVIVGSKKFQVQLVDVESEEERRSNVPFEYPDEYRIEGRTSSQVIFLIGVLSPDMVETITGAESLLVLMRAKNRPSYSKIQNFRVLFDRKCERDTSGKILVELRVRELKPIEELLKAQISVDQFYEVYVIGRSDEFFKNESPAKLDDLVGLIGLKRRADEDDFALRRRVAVYCKKMVEEPPVPDSEINQVLRQTEEEQKVEQKMDEAKGKKEKK